MRWSIFLLLFWHRFNSFNAFYFSYNKLSHSDAVSFCGDQCASNLANIDDANDLGQAIESWQNAHILSSDLDTIWIGSSYTSNEQYVQLFNDSTGNVIVRAASDVEEQSLFICDECVWQTIHKLNVDPSLSLNFDAAQSHCTQKFGTSLASIHKNTDQTQAEFCVYNYLYKNKIIHIQQ